MDKLVSCAWLQEEMAACDLRIVDASWHLPDTGRDARAEYLAGHIPGAVFLNLGELVDAGSPIDNTLPSAEDFASRMQSLGLGDGSRIVIYDDSGVKSAARAWFMLRMFGAQEVAILDGGLAKWKAEGRALDSGEHVLRQRHFTIWQDRRNLREKAQVLANIDSHAEQLVDARGAARFAGTQPEPRPGIAPGHVPGALNVPYATMFNADGTWKDNSGLKAAFAAAGVDIARPIVATCGSGMTACVLLFALHLLGIERAALYDGSWSEWGADPALPKVAGPVNA
jgi:thiosulfate/3-mercaptopyruvate sulfurtransferase